MNQIPGRFPHPPIPARRPQDLVGPVTDSALGRVFDTLQFDHRITAVMHFQPSLQVRVADWDGSSTPSDLDCSAWARFQGNPGRWVGVHVGATDRGPAFWDEAGDLRYWESKALVGEVWFSYSHDDPDVVGTLLRVIRAEGLDPVWDGPGTVVSVLLPGDAS